MIKEYLLKHKNSIVLSFFMDNEKNVVNKVENIFEKERLPFNSTEYDIENKNHCLIMLDKWIQGRGLAQSRKDLNKIKELFEVKETKELTIRSMGLNLTDHYWLHEADTDIKWENVNYFDNTFDKVKVPENVMPEIDKNVNDKSPNFCVDGSIEKRWVIKNDERVLLKGSRFRRMQEPFNEKAASMIMDYYDIEHVIYDVKRNRENIPYSECKCMVNRDVEYINAHYIFNMEDYTRKEPYKHYIDICEKKGIKNAKEEIDKMIVVDFLIGNEDRHRGNFGIIRNAENLEWIKTAPIFDNGNCLFFDCDNEELKYKGIDSLGKAFEGSNRLNLELIENTGWYNKNSEKITDITRQCLKYNERLNDERIDNIINILKERILVFEKNKRNISK